MAVYNLRIDVRHNRFCLGKTVLEAMGNPEFVQLWIRPSDLAIMVQGVSYGLRVVVTASGEFYICSKKLMMKLRYASNNAIKDGSYRIPGEISKDSGVAVFPMSQMVRLGNKAE